MVAPGADAEAGKPVKVVLYVDFICPVCKNFEAQYNEQLTTLRNEGKISVEYRPLGFLDSRSTTNYSSRAANAAACVVNESPEKYADFVNALFDKQPAEGGAGLSDDELKKMATEVGAKSIDTCIDEKTYRPWVKYATQEASTIGVTGTPTVMVDGKQWGKGDSAQTVVPGLRRGSDQGQGLTAAVCSGMTDGQVPGFFRKAGPRRFYQQAVLGLTLSSAFAAPALTGAPP